jgi:hypothetical protein
MTGLWARHALMEHRRITTGLPVCVGMPQGRM